MLNDVRYPQMYVQKLTEGYKILTKQEKITYKIGKGLPSFRNIIRETVVHTSGLPGTLSRFHTCRILHGFIPCKYFSDYPVQTSQGTRSSAYG